MDNKNLITELKQRSQQLLLDDLDIRSSARNEIKHIVDGLLKVHPEGEKFFDALDKYIREIATDKVYGALFKLAGNNALLLSGGFGYKVADDIDSGKLPRKDYILFRGGIRGGAEPQVVRDRMSLNSASVMFMDDTIYGGKTFKKIRAFVIGNRRSTRHWLDVRGVVCVYDGCPVDRSNVHSIFRYYDFYKAVPNFKFADVKKI